MVEKAVTAEELLKNAGGGYQIFVKLITGKTVVIDGIHYGSTVEQLGAKIAKKFPPYPSCDSYLTCGGRPLSPGKTLGESGVTREATIWMNGRLRGGYGEGGAVRHTLDAGIRRGNNRQTVADTNGESRAHKDWGRWLAGQDFFYEAIFPYLRQVVRGVDLGEWWEQNRIHIQALIQETTQAGNCGDFAQIVHSQLVANTGADQYVYEVVMAGAWDHQLCLTYPSKVSSIASMDPDLATIADGWDNYMVIPLRTFLNKNNCYGAKINHLDLCPDCGKSAGDGCKTADEPDKKCKGFLTIVATQQCIGDGGLSPQIKGAIGDFIEGLFDEFKQSDDYDDVVEEARTDDRGIFRFSVADDVTDKRSKKDIMGKLNQLKKQGSPTLKHELLDLDDARLMAVFGDGPMWRDLMLRIPGVRDRLYASARTKGTADFLQFVNHLADEQFLAFTDAQDSNALMVLATDYAATRLFNMMNRMADAAVITRCGSLSEAHFVAYYLSSGDAQHKILSSDELRSDFFGALLLTGDATAFQQAAALMSHDHLLMLMVSSEDARDRLLASGLKADIFAAIDEQGDSAARLVGFLPEAFQEEYKGR
jgi:hypothetical protein